jgi:hypothetical protein
MIIIQEEGHGCVGRQQVGPDVCRVKAKGFVSATHVAGVFHLFEKQGTGDGECLSSKVDCVFCVGQYVLHGTVWQICEWSKWIHLTWQSTGLGVCCCVLTSIFTPFF